MPRQTIMLHHYTYYSEWSQSQCTIVVIVHNVQRTEKRYVIESLIHVIFILTQSYWSVHSVLSLQTNWKGTQAKSSVPGMHGNWWWNNFSVPEAYISLRVMLEAQDDKIEMFLPKTTITFIPRGWRNASTVVSIIITPLIYITTDTAINLYYYWYWFFFAWDMCRGTSALNRSGKIYIFTLS